MIKTYEVDENKADEILSKVATLISAGGMGGAMAAGDEAANCSHTSAKKVSGGIEIQSLWTNSSVENFFDL